MKCVVDAHSSGVLSKVLGARALSLRLDGSVDGTQIDKIFVSEKLVTDGCGEAERVYVGVAEPKERGAVGMVNARKEALVSTFGKNGQDIVNLASSIVADGASVLTLERRQVYMGPVAAGRYVLRNQLV